LHLNGIITPKASPTIKLFLRDGVYCDSAPKLYNYDFRGQKIELRESLGTAVEDDGKKKTACHIPGLV
jgi:hypothetical protein